MFVGYQNNEQHTCGFLNSQNNYYQSGGAQLSIDNTDQRKDIAAHSNTLDGNILYTTQLGKICLVAGGYSLAIANTQSSRGTWNKGSGKYDDYVDSLSSQYSFLIATQKIRLTAQIKKQYFSCTFGGELSYSAYRQRDLLEDTIQHYQYLNIFPYFLARYNISPFRSISFGYYGSMQQPSIYQLQPEKNNNNPLNIVIGNPGLRPSFSHSFNLTISNFNVVAGSYLSGGVKFSIIPNSISSRSLIDSLGRTLTQPVNVNGNKSINIYIAPLWDLHSVRFRIGFDADLDYTRTVNFVNDLQNSTDNYTPTLGFTIGRDIPDKYNFKISSDIGYNYSHSSINSSASAQYWSENYAFEFGYVLAAQMDFSTKANYTWRQKLNASDINNQSLLWNASLDKRFAKNTLTGKLSINDILNQNKGLSSTITANEIVQSSYTTLRRYWMLSLIWNFASRPK